MNRAAWLVAVVLLAGGCAGSPAGGPFGLAVVPLGGEVRLIRDGEALLVEEPLPVGPGDVVATGPAGRARVELGTGGTLELAPSAELLVEGEPEVVEGSVLARAGDPPLTVRAGDAEIAAQRSVFRVDRDFTVTVGVYRGQADLAGSGFGPLGQLRQVSVVAGGTVPRGPQPLVVRPDDPWDAQLLGPFIDLGLELVDLQRGLSRQLPRGGGEDAIAAALEEAIPPEVLEGVLQEVGAAEAVVAAAVSQRASEVAARQITETLEAIIDLRLAGAHWIVVLAEWRVLGAELIEDLARLSGLIARFVAPPVAPDEESGPRGAGGAPGGGGGSGTTGDSGDGGSGGGTTTTGGGGGSTGGDTTTTGGGGGGGGDGDQAAPPASGCNDQVDCLVDDVVEALESPLPSPLPSPPGLP
jgi:hypothetical protein